MTKPNLEVNSVNILGCGPEQKIPRSYPDKMVIGIIDGQNEIYEGELVYAGGPIVQFKVELTVKEIELLTRLAKRVSGRLHKTLREQQGFTKEEWEALGECKSKLTHDIT